MESKIIIVMITRNHGYIIYEEGRKFKSEDFLTHYHKRSNVESTMWMIKSKFDEHIRNKTDEGIVNELYCKVLCHNICVVIQSMYELGIEPSFWTESPLAKKSSIK